MSITGKVLRSRLPLMSLCLLFTLLSVRASVAASDEEIRVLGHLPLGDMQVNQMILQQWEGKTYLYLHRPSEDTYGLVDVTKPDKPVLVSRSAMKGTAPEGPVGNSPLAITSTREGQTPTELVKQTVNFMDLSDPKGTKTIKSFKGVTAMYSDDARKLVYLVNDEGLWIVKHKNTRPVPICGGGGVNDCLYPGP